MEFIYSLWNIFKWIVIIVVIACLMYAISGVFGVMQFTPSKRVSSRTTGRLTRSIKKASTPLYGQKGTGIYKNPSRTIKNKMYRARKKKLF